MPEYTPVQLQDTTLGVHHSMNEQDDESLGSQRESNSFGLSMNTASSMAEVRGILHDYDVSEEEFSNRFPSLAKLLQGLPDETAPPA